MRLIKNKLLKNFQLVIDKRQKFAVQTILLTGGLLATQLIWQDFRFFLVGILTVCTYFLTIWSLSEDVKGHEWILLFILPVFFTFAVSLFYFLLPARWSIRLFITLIFAVGSYAILLVENIYNVAAIRSIALLRAAQSVGLLITLTIIFLMASIVYALRLNFWQHFLVLIPFIFTLTLQSLWSVNLESKIEKNIIYTSLLVSLIIGELAMSLAFWPIDNSAYALLITAAYYSVISALQHDLAGRLFKDLAREYLLVFLFAILLTYVTAKW